MTGERSARLDGQGAVVTGGASGIGRACCHALHREGAVVIVADLQRQRVETVVEEMTAASADNTPLGFACDVRSEADMAAMAALAADRCGRLDILVHCAGILRAPGSPPKFLHQMSVEEYAAVIDVNLKGTFLANRAVVPQMMRQGSGHIINFSSTSGLKGRAFDSVYCASKFGVVGLSEALAEEVRSSGIRVHVVMPDAVDTPIWNQNGPVKAPKNSLPPERVADLVTWLACLPGDTVLDHLVIRPFTARRRKRKKRKS